MVFGPFHLLHLFIYNITFTALTLIYRLRRYERRRSRSATIRAEWLTVDLREEEMNVAGEKEEMRTHKEEQSVSSRTLVVLGEERIEARAIWRRYVSKEEKDWKR
jgi:hypothetical protein